MSEWSTKRQYVVEKILHHRKIKGCLYLYVKWRNWEEPSWNSYYRTRTAETPLDEYADLKKSKFLKKFFEEERAKDETRPKRVELILKREAAKKKKQEEKSRRRRVAIVQQAGENTLNANAVDQDDEELNRDIDMDELDVRDAGAPNAPNQPIVRGLDVLNDREEEMEVDGESGNGKDAEVGGEMDADNFADGDAAVGVQIKADVDSTKDEDIEGERNTVEAEKKLVVAANVSNIDAERIETDVVENEIVGTKMEHSQEEIQLAGITENTGIDQFKPVVVSTSEEEIAKPLGEHQYPAWNILSGPSQATSSSTLTQQENSSRLLDANNSDISFRSSLLEQEDHLSNLSVNNRRPSSENQMFSQYQDSQPQFSDVAQFHQQPTTSSSLQPLRTAQRREETENAVDTVNELSVAGNGNAMQIGANVVNHEIRGVGTEHIHYEMPFRGVTENVDTERNRALAVSRSERENYNFWNEQQWNGWNAQLQPCQYLTPPVFAQQENLSEMFAANSYNVPSSSNSIQQVGNFSYVPFQPYYGSLQNPMFLPHHAGPFSYYGMDQINQQPSTSTPTFSLRPAVRFHVEFERFISSPTTVPGAPQIDRSDGVILALLRNFNETERDQTSETYGIVREEINNLVKQQATKYECIRLDSDDEDETTTVATQAATSPVTPRVKLFSYKVFGIKEIGLDLDQVECLKPGGWLSTSTLDWLISSTLNKIPETIKKTVHIVDSSLFERLTGLNLLKPGEQHEWYSKSNISVKNKVKMNFNCYLEKVRVLDLFKKDIIILPIHVPNHWLVACIIHPAGFLDGSTKKPHIFSLDSLCEADFLVQQVSEVLLKWVHGQYIRSGISEKIDLTRCTVSSPKGLPKQANTTDCGLFVSHFIEKILYSHQEILDNKDLPWMEWSDFFPSKDDNNYEALRGNAVQQLLVETETSCKEFVKKTFNIQ